MKIEIYKGVSGVFAQTSKYKKSFYGSRSIFFLFFAFWIEIYDVYIDRPCWICYIEFYDSNNGFVFSEPKNRYISIFMGNAR